MDKRTGALIGMVIVLSVLLATVITGPFLRPISESGPSILSDVPDVRQSTDYSCGAASLQAVLSYWGKDLREGVLMELLNTTSDNGTNPNDIVRVAQGLGFNASLELGLTIEDLASSVYNGVPVIIVAQAWTEGRGSNFSWEHDWQDGHYMVVIGVDSTHVYLEDPAILGSRGMISIDEFNARWHDFLGSTYDAPDALILQHMGIIITSSSHDQTTGFIPVD